MLPVIGYPSCGRPRRIEYRKEDQNVLDQFIEAQRAMRETAVKTNRSTHATN